MEELKNIYVWEFWFSDNPDDKIYWYIEKTNLSYKLILSKSFFSKDTQFSICWKTNFSNEKKWIINWNLIIENNIYPWTKRVTLFWLSCFENWMEVKSYFLKYLIFDFHFLNEEDIKFKSFKFSFDWLFQFLWKWIFDVTQINNTWWSSLLSPPDEINIKINKDILKPILFLESDWLKYSFINSGNNKQSNSDLSNRGHLMRWLQSLEIKNNSLIFVESEENNISLLEIEELLIKFQRFFTLVFWYDIKLNNLWINYKHNNSKIEKYFFNKNVNIFFNEWNINEILLEETKKSKRIETLFNYDDVKTDFWNIIKTYFDNTEKQKTIYNLYYATLENQNLHLENKFLNLIQAIEWMYLKSNIYKKRLDKLEIEEIKNEINTLCKKLKDNILIKEKKTLASKLKAIEKYLSVEFKLNNWDDLKNLIQKIRNIFSHWEDRDFTKSKFDLEVKDLLNIVELLKTVLELFILKELWFEDNLYNSIKSHKIDLDLKLKIW